MSHYKPYPAYRPSGVEWIGDVPSTWDVKRLRQVASFTNSGIDKKSYEDQEQVSLCNYTDVYYNEFITADMPFMQATASKDEIALFTLKKGDLIITKDSEDPSDIGIPALVVEDAPGVVCGYHLTLIRSAELATARLLHRALQSTPTHAYFFIESPGITRYGLGQDVIGDLRVCMPPENEVVRIADCIDRETQRIDSLISKKTRFVELLKEKRQALITHAVTKGLDPKVKMKPSGVDWIGDVPESWSFQPIKFLASIGNGSTPTKDNTKYWENGHFPWLTSSCVNQDVVTSADQFVTDAALGECHLPVITPPAVLVGITGQGRTRGMASTLLIEATINQHIAFLKPEPQKLLIEFLRMFLDASYGWLRFESEAVGSTKGAITCEQLGNTKMPLPSILEQQQILDRVRNKLSRIDRLSEKTQSSIDLLKERRSAFITAAVTGQIDLRESV